MLLGFLPLISRSPGLAADQSRVLAQWAFDREGDLLHWTPNGQLVDVKAAGGVLHCRAVGSDPILELSSLLDLPASPWQVVEIRLRADRDGIAELFWSNTNQGRYGGFGQDKTTRFQVVGDGQWHTYRLFPFWQAERKIVRLRFDVYDGATFDLDDLRIVELPMPAPAASATFDFAGSDCGWQALSGAVLEAGPLGASVTTAPGRFLSSRPSREREGRRSELRLAANVCDPRSTTPRSSSPPIARLGCTASACPSNRTARSEPTMSTCCPLATGGARSSRWGCGPAMTRPLEPSCSGLTSATHPGAAQLQIASFGVADALPRVGVPTKLEAIVTNYRWRNSHRCDCGTLPVPTVSRARPGVAGRFNASRRWASARKRSCAGRFGPTDRCRAKPASCSRSNGSGPPVRQTSTARRSSPSLPACSLARTGYVPEPKPAARALRGRRILLPRLDDREPVEADRRFPERRPLLGWYREGGPELADWQIKWAVEHGITFFAYDWYWSQGARQLEHALHDGYFNARYRHLLKFCLLWANHNPPGPRRRTTAWRSRATGSSNYFRRPEHLTVDGKPVVIVFSPQRLHRGPRDRRASSRPSTPCAPSAGRKGWTGLHLIACVGDAGGAPARQPRGLRCRDRLQLAGSGDDGKRHVRPVRDAARGLPPSLERPGRAIADSHFRLCP